jgi:hypothetical protein
VPPLPEPSPEVKNVDMRSRALLTLTLGSLSLFGIACDNGSPLMPSRNRSTLVFTGEMPPSGSTIVVSQGSPPGAFITRGSGQLSIGIQLRSGRELDWARLDVYLLTADGYCGQNLPDVPSWGPFVPFRTVDVTITGFQIYRLPCDVTGFRAMLHVRNNGLLTPPTPAETVVEGTRFVNYYLRR